MHERMEFTSEIQTIDFPFRLKNPEAFDVAMEINREEKIAAHLKFLKSHHLPSYEHCVRVGILSADLSLENLLEETRVKLNTASGSLHDIGKCAVSPEILNKSVPLTAEEKVLMRSHVRESFTRLSDPYFNGIKERVVRHHEFRNGDSYPRKRTIYKNENEHELMRTEDQIIEEDSSLIAAADVFDALAVKRPYNPKFDIKEIEKIMRHDFSGNPKYIEQILSRYNDK